MSETLTTQVLVIGAGVVGLAVAAELSKNQEVILAEQYPQFGRETSSRNSEVIHSGIYYPKDSLKTRSCIEGRKLLYEYCEKNQVPYRKCGKFVVATSLFEEEYLEKLFTHSKELGVPVEKVSKSFIEKKEPLIQVATGLFFPETGIIDSHQLMQKLEDEFKRNGGTTAYRHQVVEIGKSGKWITGLKAPEENLTVESDIVVNCTGLNGAELSNRVLRTKKYSHRFCRGRYFSLAQKYQNKFQHLIYPVPVKDGLGVHVTIDTAGFARLGPDVDWCHPEKNYSEVSTLYDCDWEALRRPFAEAAKKYFPTLEEKEVSPGLIGIRPKLFLHGEARPDFLIENHDGFIHCLGIESPGLTAALSLAKLIK